jgi:hypothetical protein
VGAGNGHGDTPPAEDDDPLRRQEAARMAVQLADFAWAGLRQVHRV